MEAKVSINCEVKYQLIGFGGISGHYTSKDFEIVYDYLKEYNTEKTATLRAGNYYTFIKVSNNYYRLITPMEAERDYKMFLIISHQCYQKHKDISV